MFNCDDVATLLTKRKQKFAGSFARMLCELVASRDFPLTTITITTFFSCVVAVVIVVLLFVFFLHGCLYDEIKMYIYARRTKNLEHL